MIVPRSRLLIWWALLVVPFSLAGAIAPTGAILAISAIGAFVALALLDALGARTSLGGIAVALPPLSRFSKDRSARLEVRIRNPQLRSRTVRLALGLPPQLSSETEETDVSLPADAEWSSMAWSCRPRQRGCYRVRRAYLEAASPLGFWGSRKAIPVQAEIRVYPNLLQERRSLAAVFLRRGMLGAHAQRQVGKGREFEKLREYLPGDSFEDIHWKATARRGHPITKVYQIERTQEIYVLLDGSRLSARPASGQAPGSSGRAKAPGAGPPEPVAPGSLGGHRRASDALEHSTLERFVTAALVLGLAAEQQGDLFGLLTFTDQVDKFLRARNGKAHYGACRDTLYTLQPRDVTPDFDELSTFVRLRLRRRALLFILTALDDPVLAEGLVRNLDLICRYHLVVVAMLQPQGVAPLFANPQLDSEDELYRQLGGHLRWRQLRELRKVLQRRGVQFTLLQNERLSADLVSQYLAIKHRQLL